jgi:hypothetical protein
VVSLAQRIGEDEREVDVADERAETSVGQATQRVGGE